MKILSRLGRLILLVTAVGVLGSVAAAVSASYLVKGTGHSSNLMAKITMPDGFSRTVVIQGVGCNVSICSRVAVRSKTEASARLTGLGLHKEVSTWLDSLAAIKDITKTDALFVFKDGSARRLSIIDGNRFFYFANALFGSGKVDVATVRSVEFLTNESE